MEVRPVCRGPWTEAGPEVGSGLEPEPGPDCGLHCGRSCCHSGFPGLETAWLCWPPALFVSAPASATPGSLGEHGR